MFTVLADVRAMLRRAAEPLVRRQWLSAVGCADGTGVAEDDRTYYVPVLVGPLDSSQASVMRRSARTTQEQKSWASWVRTVVAVLVPERLTHSMSA